MAPGVDAFLWGANKAMNNIGGWFGSPVDKLMGWKGGQCGEYGEWGNKWSEKACKDLFGEDTVITQITAQSPTNSGNNHNSSRIITPNGDRFVIDYWQGMQDKQAVYTEDEWVRQQTEKGRGKIVRTYTGDESDILKGGEEGMLNHCINRYGEEEGIKKFMSKSTKDLPYGKRQALVLSYKKSPWPTK